MPHSNFFSISLPHEQVLKGVYLINPINPPAAPVVGSWQQRYCHLNDILLTGLDRVYDFEVREDDVWIVTLPKCGTTWMQELAWLVLNDCDFETAKSVYILTRSPFLEPNDTIEAANALSSPRLIKSHLPAWLLPRQLWIKKPKIIYVYRNPKDAAISHFHHLTNRVPYSGTKEDFLSSYLKGYPSYTPFWPHVLDFWQLRHEPHIFFTSYERMKNQLGEVIQDVAHFLQREVSGEQVKQMKEHLSFESMRDNPACNHPIVTTMKPAGPKVEEFKFYRRGVVGSHKDEMTADMIQKFDLWSEDNLREYNLTVDDFSTYSKYSD